MNGVEVRRPVDILVVEDNPGDVRLAFEAIKEGKIPSRIAVARDGEEALAMLRREGRHLGALRPDLIVLDLNLPRKDGRELLRDIKTDPALKRIPVIVLTSSNAEQDVLKAYELYASCYIIKPVGFEEFIGAIRAFEHFWLQVATLPPRA